MSNYSGFSQASSISGMSSRLTNAWCPLKADLSMECSDRVTRASIYSGRRINQLEEVNKAFAQCQDIISDYAIKKLMYDCIIEASLNMDESLTQNTAEKLKQLITAHEVEKYLHLPNNLNDLSEKITLLGIADLPKVELSYEEKLDIKRSIENKLHKRAKAFLSRFEGMGGSLDELTKKVESTSYQQISEVFETDLFQWRQQIDERCIEYEKDILEYKNLFSEWINLKYDDMNNSQLKKAESLLVKVQVSEVQAKITKLNCILKMFQETPITLKAYQMVNSYLDRKISETEEELQRKKAIIKLYEDLHGTEYDQVAQKYSELCKAIEKKKRIMENL